MDPQSFDDMRTGCYDIHDRVKDMNANGLLGSMCFPSLPAVLRPALRPHRQKDDADLAARARAGVQRLAHRRLVRRVPGPVHPARDPDDVGRRADGGRGAARRREGLPRGHVLREPRAPRPPEHPLRPLGPVLRDVRGARHGPVHVHIGSSSKMVITAPDAPMDVLITLSPINIVQAAADFVWSPVPKKFPKLKFALSEGGIGWIPYFRERIDYTYDRHRFWTGQDMGDRTAEPGLRRAGHLLLDRRPGRRRDAAQDERRHDLLGVRLPALRLDVAAVARELHEADAGRELLRRGHRQDLARERDAALPVRPVLGARRRENCTVGALRAQAEGWDVSIQSRGIKASGDRCRRPRQVLERAND